MRRTYLKCLLGLALLVVLCSSAAAQIPNADVNSREFIRSWLICGPMDNPLPPEIKEYQFYRTLLGFNIDYLTSTGGETGTNPTEGLKFAAADGKTYTWTAYQASSEGYVNFQSAFAQNRRVVAYAACRLVSDADKEVWLGLGSDDGVKVWLNGELVWANPVPRLAKPDEDLVRLHVKKGDNLLLIKVDNGEGGWGFYARMVDQDKMAEAIKTEYPKSEIPLDLTIEKTDAGLQIVMGRMSRYRILGTRYTVTMRDAAGKSVRFGGAPLGDPVSISCAGVKPGPYWLDCVPQLAHGSNFIFYHGQVGRVLLNNPGLGIFYHHGKSSVTMKNYGRDGKPLDLPIMVLDKGFNVIGNAFADDVVGGAGRNAGAVRAWRDMQAYTLAAGTNIAKSTVASDLTWTGPEPGRADLLRTDILPFRVQVLLDLKSLGRRWFLLDNQGKGYTAPPSGQTTLDLPLEAARCERARLQRTLDEHPNLPAWLRANLQKRVDDTAALSSNTLDHRQVFEMLDRLCEFRNSLPSEGPVKVWCASGVEKISKTEPVPESVLDAARVSLAKNEYEPFQIVLTADRPMNGLTVKFETPKSDSGASISAADLDVKLVEYVQIKTTSDDAVLQWPGVPTPPSYGKPGLWPDPLPPIREQFSLTPGENQPLWITVHAPKGQKPGIYRGALLVMSGKDAIARAPFEVQVFDITLPDETHTATAIGVSTAYKGGTAGPYHGPLDAKQVDAVYDMYMKMFASHRTAPLFLRPSAAVQATFEGSPPHPVLDFKQFDEAMTRYLDEYKFTSLCLNAMPGDLAGFPMYSPEYNRLFKEQWSVVQEHLREKGWLEKAYWYPGDEPIPVDYPTIRQRMELLKWACPDIRRLMTFHVDVAPVPYFYGLINLWCPIMHNWDANRTDGDLFGYSAERAHARQALGERVWWYTCNIPVGPYANYFIDNPGVNHRMQFWLMDKYNVDGFLYWDITSWLNNPWEQPMLLYNEAGLGNGCGVFLYPPRRTVPETPVIEPPVTSIRFEAVRDGLEDREYLLMLKTAASSKNRNARVARRILDSAHNELTQTLTCFEQNPAVFTAARYAVAEAVESTGRH